MRRSRRSTLLLAVAAMTLVVLVVLAWMASLRALPVRVAVVERAPLIVHVVTNGTVEPANDVEVRARLDGRVVTIVEAGTRVEAGQVVLRIDDSAVAADLARARSERLAAQEELRMAKAALARVRERAAADRHLFQAGALTAEAFRETQAAFDEARTRHAFLAREVPLRVDSLRLRIKELRAQANAAAVPAPFAGTVYRRVAKPEQVVRAGDPVLWVADLAHVRVRVNVDQVDLGRVHEGQQVVVSSNAFPGKTTGGTITEVIPNVMIKEGRSVSEALVTLEDTTGGLVPGMTVDVEIVVDEIDDALLIPGDAVFVENGRSYAYRLDRGRLRRTPIVLGRSNVIRVEVRSGLDVGDSVVVFPRTGVADGIRVDVLAAE